MTVLSCRLPELGNVIEDFILEYLAAHEGGGPSIIFSYDDATFMYIVRQGKKSGYGRTLEDAIRCFLDRAI